MKRKQWFVYVPVSEPHAAFISSTDDHLRPIQFFRKNKINFRVVQTGLTKKDARKIAMMIRRRQLYL